MTEFDWGQAKMVVARQSVTAQFLSLRLRWSHMPYVTAYPHQQQEAMFDGLVKGFTTLGGVTELLIADNLKQAVQKILEGKNRKEQEAFIAFRTKTSYDLWKAKRTRKQMIIGYRIT